MPYMGSKNKIAEWIISQLPSAKHFYDCFGGGGAITHCAALSGKYEHVHYNEYNPLVFKCFKMAVNGDFKHEKRWISREDFNKLKDVDPYVAYCFSFGNNPLKSYAYAKDVEPCKKALHYSICFNDNSLLSKIVDIKNLKYTSNDLHERRLQLQYYIKSYINDVENGNVRNVLQNLERLQQLESLQRLEMLQSLQGLERLQSLQGLQSLGELHLTNKSYNELEFEKDSVVYCDPPYINTSKYRSSSNFDHEEFYDWCRNIASIGEVYISEYTMPNDFYKVSSVNKRCSLGSSNNKNTVESLYTVKDINLELW